VFEATAWGQLFGKNLFPIFSLHLSDSRQNLRLLPCGVAMKMEDFMYIPQKIDICFVVRFRAVIEFCICSQCALWVVAWRFFQTHFWKCFSAQTKFQTCV